ncbi:MAG: exodeoxyribonuclease VII large subunit [Bacteroides sp.]
MSETTYTLYELNNRVRQVVESRLDDEYWVQAELSEVHLNRNGHCYLEFVERDEATNTLVAKARGTIWSNVYRLLAPYFEEATGHPFAAGIRVQVLVQVQFHELYGYSLSVTDIDPTYTLGDLMRHRKQILDQLEREGVLTLNKELPMPMLPQRVAVISSATAAGYGDFCHQLDDNRQGYYFHVELFPAIMQGKQVEESLLQALDAIMARQEQFDVVVIIRGGGAVSDLTGFDTYLLASACAQFPLPIITGIGHERDDTVIDAVAHTRVKTPTAAAQYLIGCMDEAAIRLDELSQRLKSSVEQRLMREHLRLETLRNRIPQLLYQRMAAARQRISSLQEQLQYSVRQRQKSEAHRLALLKQRVADASPQRLLALGYTLTLKEGRYVKEASQLSPGDRVEIHFRQGKVKAIVSD